MVIRPFCQLVQYMVLLDHILRLERGTGLDWKILE